MAFKVVRCPHCSFFQVTSSKTSLKCQKCGKTKVMSYLKVYFKSEDGREAARALASLKAEAQKDKGKYSEDFEDVL